LTLAVNFSRGKPLRTLEGIEKKIRIQTLDSLAAIILLNGKFYRPRSGSRSSLVCIYSMLFGQRSKMTTVLRTLLLTIPHFCATERWRAVSGNCVRPSRTNKDPPKARTSRSNRCYAGTNWLSWLLYTIMVQDEHGCWIPCAHQTATSFRTKRP